MNDDPSNREPHAREPHAREQPPRRFAGDGGWLELVYSSQSAGELREHYDTWAASYDDQLADVWCDHVVAGAGLLATHLPDRDARILDAGAGTGLVGQALGQLGYRQLTAVDLSPAMLGQARVRGVYREVRCGDFADPAVLADCSPFAAVIAMGVFARGHAGHGALCNLVEHLEPGGLLVLSIHDNYLPAIWPALAALPLEPLQRSVLPIYRDESITIAVTRRLVKKTTLDKG